MEKFEYLHVNINLCPDKSKLVDFLNERGQDGWEMVTIISTIDGFDIYFKRGI